MHTKGRMKMQLAGLGQYKNLNDLICKKIQRYGENPTHFSTLFHLMFSEEENVIAETMSGYRIQEITYGQTKKNVLSLAATLSSVLSPYEKDSLIGLCMSNGLPWIETFWAILIAGYKPLLINSRLSQSVLEGILEQYGVRAVISDSMQFSACPTYIQNEIPHAEENFDVAASVFGTEVIFMSSGTQDEVKLCAYTAERFYYQICDTYYIVKDCPQIRKGCEGKIKQLALLPFYHVFGFMAVYLWFGFFSRTFVFLKDLSPQTLLNTVRRHKVTHIFAVPLVWETIYKTAMRTVESKGERVMKRFNKGLALAKKGGIFKKLTHKAFSEVREQIFGDSIRFLISGGSSVDPKAVEFFNAIGYHIANGYGMTETGITSVELSLADKKRNSLSIGKPFRHTEYKCEDGKLYVKSNTRATRILYKGQETVTDFDEWFSTGDLAVQLDATYFIRGRADDLLIGESGENINPNLVEHRLRVEGVNELCLFRAQDGATVLLLSCPKAYSNTCITEIRARTEEKLRENCLSNEIRRIVLTSSPLMGEKDFKISRKKVAKKYSENGFDILTADSFCETEQSPLQKKLKGLFAKALQKDEAEIGIHENFFSSLGGSSLDYFTLIGLIKEDLGVILPVDDAERLSTVRSMEEYIKRSDL